MRLRTMDDSKKAIIGAIATFATGLISFFVGKRQKKAAIEKTEAEVKDLQAKTELTEAEQMQLNIANLQDIVKFYKGFTDDLKISMTQLSEELTHVKSECAALREKILEMGKEMSTLSTENHQLKSQIVKLQTLIKKNGSGL